MTARSKTYVASLTPSSAPATATWTAPNALFGGVNVTVAGAAGGTGIGGAPGGDGGILLANIEISDGQQIDIWVGKQGGQGSGGGGNGFTDGADGGTGGLDDGGAGGGSSAIKAGASPPTGYSAGDLILLAGAGGGGGGNGGPGETYKTAQGWYFAQGGYGGIFQQAGFVGYDNTGGPGGAAGDGAAEDGTGGAAGTGGGGAAAGTSGSGSTAGAGGSGATGVGGSGGGGGGGVATACGGGGGGGQANAQGGGGSGGSSYRHSGDAVFNDNANEGDGYVTLAWTEADAPITANATPQNNSFHDAWDVGIAFSWDYKPQTDSGTQTAFALRIQTFGGAYHWWNGSDFSATTEQWITSTASSLTVGASLIQNAGAYVWSVATQESNRSLQGPYSPDWIFTTPAAPVVNISVPSGHTAILQPEVQWTSTLDSAIDSFTQTKFRVLIYTLAATQAEGFYPGIAGALFDSTLTTSSHEYCVTSGVTYVTGDTYVAFVQITQTDGVVSAWDSSTYIADPLAPLDPSLCVCDPTGDGYTANIIVTGHDTNDLVGAAVCDIDYSTDNGVSWHAVVVGTPMSFPGQMAAINDALGQHPGKLWRAQLKSPTGAATPSNFVVTPSVTIGNGRSAHIQDPAVGDVSDIPIWIVKFEASDRPIMQGIFQGIGNDSDIVLSDVRRKRTGAMTIATQNNAERDVLLMMLRDPHLLWITRPPNDPNAPGESIYFVPTGQVVEDKPTRVNRVLTRTIKFTFSEQPS